MATLKHSFLALALLASPFLAQAQNNASDGGYTYYHERGEYAAERPSAIAPKVAPAKSPATKTASGQPIKPAKTVKPMAMKNGNAGKTSPAAHAEEHAIVESHSDGGYTYQAK
jgi:hypothetical protein